MSGDPWLHIIGWNEGSAEALTPASRAALDAAEAVFGGPRHLEQAGVGARAHPWPVPFSVDPVLVLRGRRVVVLASGDPFWFGAGSSITAALEADEWLSHPAPSTFALAANALGWRLEGTTCHGLHAAPYARLRGQLAPNARMLCTLRDGSAPAELAAWLAGQGAGDARLWVMERLGGAAQRIRETTAQRFALTDIAAPVMLAVALPACVGLPRASGLPDKLFASDGQITKRPVRALTLSALAPRRGAVLWDLGAGSGSVSVEWCLAGGRAIAVERRADRVANITRNAADFGVDHLLKVHTGDSIALINGLPAPDAVFVGGGGSQALYDALFATVPPHTCIVANGVTLETEALLAHLHATHGGDLLRIDLAVAEPLGGMRGWAGSRPVVQWRVTT